MIKKNSSGVLASIVNLDQEQLHTLDDQGSYGANDDIADAMNPSHEITETAAVVANIQSNMATVSAAAEIGQPTPTVPEAPQYLQPNNIMNPQNISHESRRARIKNAITSKWRFHKPKNVQQQTNSSDDTIGDIETNYISFHDPDAITPVKSTSLENSASIATNQIHATTPPSSDLLGIHNPNTYANNPTPSPQQTTLSSELFHWYIHRSWKKKLLTLLVVSSSAVVLYDLVFCRGVGSEAAVGRFLDWMNRHPILGIYGYIGILAVTSLVYIPPSPLIISSGFIFRSIYGPFSGPLLALLSSYVGAVLGGSIGFLRANYMTRDLIRILMRRYPLLRAIDTAVVRNSLRVMILLRLNPLIPFGVLNYLFGISGVSGASFVLGVIGVVPWHLWLISVGASANSLIYDDENATVFRIVLLGMGSACGVIGLVITWKFAKKELQKEMNEQAINDFRIQDSNLSPQTTPRRNENAIEEADLEFGDYVRMQFFGMNVDDDVEIKEQDYRATLDWELRILDDFS